MNKSKQKQVKIGYQLRVKLPVKDMTKATFETTGGLFDSKHQAEAYRAKHYSNLTYRIQGVRLNTEPATNYLDRSV